MMSAKNTERETKGRALALGVLGDGGTRTAVRRAEEDKDERNRHERD
jgi:hypothetical protein